MISDTDFVIEQLRRYPQGRDAVQIISASFRERDCGVGAVHSRISSLREKGYTIPPAEIEGKTRRGFPRYVYRLVAEPEESGRNVDAGALRPESQADTPGMPPVSPRLPEPTPEPLTQLELA